MSKEDPMMIDGKRNVAERSKSSPRREMEKDPIEHKRGKGDPNSEKYIVFQDLKELIQVTPCYKS
ncbi:MAG: hypothetical protein ACLRZG_04245 [Streptococcus sp.]